LISLGSSITNYLSGDVDMAEGVKDPQTLLKIGFINDKVEDRIEAYKKVYDVLVLHDGSFEFLLNLLKDLLSSDSA
jgi:5'-nucleotidase